MVGGGEAEAEEPAAGSIRTAVVRWCSMINK